MTQDEQIYHNKDAKRGVDYIGVNCVFFCHDGQGNILLHKRSSACRDEQGRWDCGGGSMEFGETFDETVAREISEEYCAKPLEIVRTEAVNVLRNNNGVDTHWIAVVHAVKLDPAETRIGEPAKMEELGWFKYDELPEPLHSMFLKHFDLVKPHIVPGYENS
ncbi:MAG: NUDIX domain-containing protein [Patescibacteria group bacterium]|jgi:ADP-ribose pyrophosphatase YjhB (NUDIX family)|nr:NUDIX domain-containing protein [Patescibacteria group bacterium]